MAKKRQFEIAFVGLKPGIHEFNYELDDKFFSVPAITVSTASAKSDVLT